MRQDSASLATLGVQATFELSVSFTVIQARVNTLQMLQKLDTSYGVTLVCALGVGGGGS